MMRTKNDAGAKERVRRLFDLFYLLSLLSLPLSPPLFLALFLSFSLSLPLSLLNTLQIVHIVKSDLHERQRKEEKESLEEKKKLCRCSHARTLSTSLPDR
jgi:hypothetical protein